ncbi:MAG TPA: hypothetical protein VGQ05_08320 [Streptosporangiaceae bacterium]|nr:hypothetical protein [Streptosporangiaceae bacterium]
MIKVAFIGAGSVEFTRNVVTDLCSYPELTGRLHFALHDISAERLSWADRLTRRIVAQTGANAEVTTTLARREALSTRTPRPRSPSIRPSPCATTCWRRTGRCCPRRCCADPFVPVLG